MTQNHFFTEREGCPFCKQSNHPVLHAISYHETAEANRNLPNIYGKLYHCRDCGIAYPSHIYEIAAFEKLYQKSYSDLNYFNESCLQVIRKKYIKETLRYLHQPLSLSRLLETFSLSVFQVPYITLEPKGLRICDIGCGFGEFLSIYQDLGNHVMGTEIHPALVQRLTQMGFTCKQGELEHINFDETKFDVIIFRGVFYRTRDPITTIQKAKNALSPGGEIALVEPCPGLDGVEYFFKKQFPQGQFYILDKTNYLQMIQEKFGLNCTHFKQIYGRPNAPLKSIRFFGNIIGFVELILANLLKQKPYMLNFTLKPYRTDLK